MGSTILQLETPEIKIEIRQKGFFLATGSAGESKIISEIIYLMGDQYPPISTNGPTHIDIFISHLNFHVHSWQSC